MQIERATLIEDLKSAIENRRGFALGKLGYSEQALLGYPLLLNSNYTAVQKMAYETMLRYHCDIQTGVFPTDLNFLKEFTELYTEKVKSLDIIGLFENKNEQEIISKCAIISKTIPYQATEPNRSIPYQISNCYLPLFENKKILIISPFASFLEKRANIENFESVWEKIKLPWFKPSSVNSIDIPYSYITVQSTRQEYTSSITLLNEICLKISKKEFDIALIGAGALGIPIASYIKEMGKIGISLGGHLQVIFGVNGKRWFEDSYWQNNYINNHWIDLPLNYQPQSKDILTDGGAYW